MMPFNYLSNKISLEMRNTVTRMGELLAYVLQTIAKINLEWKILYAKHSKELKQVFFQCLIVSLIPFYVVICCNTQCILT